MKDHFMISESDGALYDTRDWSHPPLRPHFQQTFRKIETLAQLKATLRNGEYAWPGGYQMYLVMSDGEPATFKGALDNWREIVSVFMSDLRGNWRVVGCDIYFEGPPMECAITGTMIESAYGDPEADAV